MQTLMGKLQVQLAIELKRAFKLMDVEHPFKIKLNK